MNNENIPQEKREEIVRYLENTYLSHASIAYLVGVPLWMVEKIAEEL